MKREIIDASQLELNDKVVSIKRVTKVVKGGRNMRFAALVVVGDGNGHVGAGGAKREVSSELLEDLEPGDYVMVHAGVAIAKITEEDDEETDQLMEELL